MDGAPRSAGTLGELLSTRRRFVGRAGEVELFRAALDAVEPTFSVLHVHGPGGIGKTSLLDAFAGLAVDSGATVVRVDGRSLRPAPEAVLAALGGELDVPVGGGPITTGGARVVFLLDTYERLAPLDDWLRDRLLPRLPADAVTVIAGRDPPAPAWRADTAWRDLLRVVSLRNWTPQESRRYLDACGVAEGLHGRFVEITHGHPFGLSLLADVVARGGEAPADPLTPDLVRTLLRQFIDAVPSDLHRRALEVCALSRVTTEALLRRALDLDDAHELFGWLRALSFVESAQDGVFPHDLARDALDVDLRWRDLDGYKRVFRGVRAHVHSRLAAARGHEQQRAAFDEKFLFRNLPGILSPVDWDSWGHHYPQPARVSDRDAILDLVHTWEGSASAVVAERWWDRQPEAFHVLRREDDGVRGFLALLDLSRASAADIAADPGATAAWEHARRHTAPRPGEAVTQSRFIIDREVYQGPSPTLNAAPVLTIAAYLRTPNLAWDFLTLAAPDQWDEYFAIADLPRAVGADFTLDGCRFGLFAHDFRRVPVDAWLELVTERALARDFTAPQAPPASPTLVLSQAEFDDAVRQALRDLHRPDLLARNPLLRTRLLRGRGGNSADGEPDAAALAGVVREAVQALADHPRDDKLLRAVDRTYLRPAATQERAAEVLGLPFSTYRRHLARGLARVGTRLWEQELYGNSEQH